MGRVQGKVALVSSSASGIGKATAMLLASEGAKVIVSDINVSAGREVVRQIKSAGGEAIFIRIDVTIEHDWVKAINKIVEKFGKLDILVNNAGIALVKPVENTTVDDFWRVFSVNMESVFLGTKHAFGTMKNTGGGVIINMSSQTGIRGSRSSALYSAAKGAVRLFSKSTAIEGSKAGLGYNIRVNSVHPGSIETPMKWALEAQSKGKQPPIDWEKRIPMGRTGQPEDVAKTILFIASDDASYITGAEFVVDGGLLA